MGQVLRKDKIGTLSHNAGIISLTASVLTIGGQQYETAVINRTITSDVTLAANSRYQVYAVLSGGIVSMRISTNENSVGPAGFNSWSLVGSFITTHTAAFGDFLLIDSKFQNLVISVSTNGTFTPPSGAQIKITNWATGNRYFDDSNSFMRLPIGGNWSIGIKAYHNGDAGATSQVWSNAVFSIYGKATLPSSVADAAYGLVDNSPIFGGTIPTEYDIVDLKRSFTSGYYLWLWLQSNDYTRGFSVAVFTASLDSLDYIIKDL